MKNGYINGHFSCFCLFFFPNVLFFLICMVDQSFLSD